MPNPLEDSASPSAEWQAVASLQRQKELKAEFIWNLPIEEFRALGYTPPPLPASAPVPGVDLTIDEWQIHVSDGHQISLRVYKPMEPSPRSLLFFNAHGGGWVLGIPQTEEAQNRAVAVENRAVVVSVDYRKAPEFRYPYALNDCFDALIWCKENAEILGIDSERIVLGGGSAGANLTAALALRCRDKGISGIIGQVLNIPVTCHPAHFPRLQFNNTSLEQNNDAPIVSTARMRWFWDQYAPDIDTLDDPYLSPLLTHSLESLPPTLIQVAGMDPLRDEGLAYAMRLEEAGVGVEVKLYPGVPHAFYTYPELPQSSEYLETIVGWISRLLNKSDGSKLPVQPKEAAWWEQYLKVQAP